MASGGMMLCGRDFSCARVWHDVDAGSRCCAHLDLLLKGQEITCDNMEPFMGETGTVAMCTRPFNCEKSVMCGHHRVQLLT
jgi:hypothetical protein